MVLELKYIYGHSYWQCHLRVGKAREVNHSNSSIGFSNMSDINLVFIPSPGVGHLSSTIEIAKILLHRDPRLSITVMIMSYPEFSVTSITSLITSDRIDFIEVSLPSEESNPRSFFHRISSMKPLVKKAISDRKESRSDSDPKLAGFVVDMFFTTMIDVADELGVPTYVYLTSNALFLALLLHVQKLCDDEGVNVMDFEDSDLELCLPEFLNSVPARLLPSAAFDKVHGFSDAFNLMARDFRRTKGILINSFFELESFAVRSMRLDHSVPSIYPVGPVVKIDSHTELIKSEKETLIMEWLDTQPPASVVFLCFGSMGAFPPAQVAEMARGIESSGCRFLWSLRRRSSSQAMLAPLEDYEDFTTVLPDGFLHRTATIGKIIGWAPQAAVLGHLSIGGFVSHCGWNSTLESLWFGVPIATWPLYAEQQLNAFLLVKEIGIGVEISVDYRVEIFKHETKEGMFMSSDKIEKGIKELMEEESEVRKKVKLLMKKCREAVEEGGSSYAYVQNFIDDLRKNIGA